MSIRGREAYMERVDAGLCGLCGKANADPTYSTCHPCRERARLRVRQRQQGVESPPEARGITPSARYCQVCGGKGHQRPPCPKPQRPRKKCIRCSAPPEPGSDQCTEHLRYAAELAKEGWLTPAEEVKPRGRGRGRRIQLLQRPKGDDE